MQEQRCSRPESLQTCRSRYVDVLEWILFLNANADVLYTLVWGDKDLYELGFALAGLLQHYTQVSSCTHSIQGWLYGSSGGAAARSFERACRQLQ